MSLILGTELYDRFWEVRVGTPMERHFTPVFRGLVRDIRSELDELGTLGAGGAEILMRPATAPAAEPRVEA